MKKTLILLALSGFVLGGCTSAPKLHGALELDSCPKGKVCLNQYDSGVGLHGGSVDKVLVVRKPVGNGHEVSLTNDSSMVGTTQSTLPAAIGTAGRVAVGFRHADAIEHAADAKADAVKYAAEQQKDGMINAAPRSIVNDNSTFIVEGGDALAGTETNVGVGVDVSQTTDADVGVDNSSGSAPSTGTGCGGGHGCGGHHGGHRGFDPR